MAKAPAAWPRSDRAIAVALAAATLTLPLTLVPASLTVVRVPAGVLFALALVAAVAARPEAGVYALVVTATLRDLGAVVPGVPVTFAEVVLAAGLLSWGWRAARGAAEERRPLGPLALALAAPFAAALVTSLTSLDRAKSATYSLRLLALWLGVVFLVSQVRTTKRLRRTLAVLAATGSVLAAFAVVQRVAWSAGLGRTVVSVDLARNSVIRPAAFYLDPNFLACLLAGAACAALALGVATATWRKAAPWLAAAAVCLAGVLVTLSRTGLVVFALGLAIVVMTAPKGRRVALAVVAAAVAIAGVVAVPLVAQRARSVTDFEGDASISTRVLMIGSTTQMIGEYWLTGTGLAAFEKAYPAFRRPGAIERVTRPHQLPLAMWAEMGLPGLLAELAIVAAVVWSLLLPGRLGWLAEDSAVTAMLAVLVAGSLFQYFMYFEPLWFALALTAAMPHRKEA